MVTIRSTLAASALLLGLVQPALFADNEGSACRDLPSYSDLKSALKMARAQANGGFNLDMWVPSSIVTAWSARWRSLALTAVPNGRAAARSRLKKANTANAFSLPGLALSTANLYTATQPGGTLYGLQHSNPVDPQVVYKGNGSNYGQSNDPMVGEHPGGVNVFGGGLALYNSKKQLIGAIGVSGDSSCADHNIAWRTRNFLKLDYIPGGSAISGDASRPDNIVYDIAPQPGQMPGISAGGWGHPVCSADATTIAGTLPAKRQ